MGRSGPESATSAGTSGTSRVLSTSRPESTSSISTTGTTSSGIVNSGARSPTSPWLSSAGTAASLLGSYATTTGSPTRGVWDVNEDVHALKDDLRRTWKRREGYSAKNGARIFRRRTHSLNLRFSVTEAMSDDEEVPELSYGVVVG